MAQRASRVEPRIIRPMHFGNAWDFLCRALSESKSKTQLELSANDTCALKENERKRSTNLVQQVYVEHLENASQRLTEIFINT